MAKEKNTNVENQEAEEMTVTLTLDDGSELECVVLTIFEAGERDYIALLPLDGKEAEDGEVFLIKSFNSCFVLNHCNYDFTI